MMGKENHSRRNFLKTAIVGAAGGVSAGPAWADPRQVNPCAQQCGSVYERPPQQHGNNLNLIVIVSDTFRHDNLACYGPKWLESLQTPNLDRFAQQAVVFQDAYAELLPTIPLRRTLYTGRRGIPAYYFPQQEPVQLPGWHPLYFEDVTLSETLLQAGYLTALISDVYHQFKPGRNFQRGFHTYRWIRGQEFDDYGTSPHGLLDVGDIVPSEYLARFPGLHDLLSQYKANCDLWKQQGESLAQIVADTAMGWLQQNFQQRPFYLHVELFDPHEPWDPPRRFLDRYLPDATGPSFLEPTYDTVPLSDQIQQRFRANYAGEVNCVDYWIGNLLNLIGELGLLENSVVVFMSDHGAMLGEHQQFLKGPDKLRGQVTHIPLLIRTPQEPYAGKKVPGFVQPPDVMPTLLHLLGLQPPSRVTGTNLWPLVTGETKSARDYVVQTYLWVGAVRDHEWSYTEIWKPEAHQEQFHVHPAAPLTIYKPQLYNLEKDPHELTDVADQHPDIARQMSAKMKEYITSGEGITYGSFNSKPSLDTREGLYSK
jgi:arylsulfatase A-like enzyme